MASEKPKSRLPDGRVNPAYTKWRKERKAESETALTITIGETRPDPDEHSPEPSVDSRTIVGSPGLLLAEPETLSLRVVKLARNAKFVYCDLDGVKVPVRVKKGLQKRLLKKHINVRKEGEIYVHIR